jgi:hypothetical protein
MIQAKLVEFAPGFVGILGGGEIKGGGKCARAGGGHGGL